MGYKKFSILILCIVPIVNPLFSNIAISQHNIVQRKSWIVNCNITALVASQMYDQRDSKGLWIGLQDEGSWTWIDGEVATWTNWAPNEPANVDPKFIHNHRLIFNQSAYNLLVHILLLI